MTDQAEQPDVGSILKQARLKRGQSLEVVFQHTRIQKRFLEALEANRFEDIPGQVYLRGFLRLYCDHLDLDFDALWTRIVPKPAAAAQQASEQAEPRKPAAEPRAAAAQLSAAGQPPASQPPAAGRGSRQPADQEPRASPFSGGALWLALAVGLGAGGFYWLSGRGSGPKPQPVPAPVPPAPIAPIRPPQAMKLKVSFRREAVIRVRCDGVLRFEGRLPAGTEQEWSAMQDFVLSAPAPDDVVVRLDGSEVRLLPAMRDASGNYKLSRR